MNTTELDEMMRKRLLKAASGPGRTTLECAVAGRRLLWAVGLRGASLAKRALDVVGSALLIIAFLPVLAVVALLIKLEDGGPLIFTQNRVGKFGRMFRMYKFRSMCVNAEQRMAEVLAQNQHQTGVTFKMKTDPRITKVGRWLRKLSVDELPQLFNVLIGDMSLVGPRPPVPREVALYTLADRRRLAVKPGITCFWQVGGRAELDFPQQVALDVSYIERQSILTDLIILFKTVPAVIGGKGAC
ncbi:MAG TPA: sugar transferase [Verrucomicrobiae bacterium]|jgi:lipopolysaccharide/colanic/teichoic acid biosynthesis glycosyltransferase|nr:sugar transferase [Verrucomicrobiae bacterium]